MKAGKGRGGSQIRTWFQAKCYRESVQFIPKEISGVQFAPQHWLDPRQGHRAFQLPNSSVIGLEARRFPEPAKDSLLKKELQVLVIESKISLKPWLQTVELKEPRRSGGNTNIIHYGNHWIVLLFQLLCKVLGHILEGLHNFWSWHSFKNFSITKIFIKPRHSYHFYHAPFCSRNSFRKITRHSPKKATWNELTELQL